MSSSSKSMKLTTKNIGNARIVIERQLPNGRRQSWSQIIDPSIAVVFFDGEAYLLSDLIMAGKLRASSNEFGFNSINTEAGSKSSSQSPPPSRSPLAQSSLPDTLMSAFARTTTNDNSPLTRKRPSRSNTK
jgi:hypothetical protein